MNIIKNNAARFAVIAVLTAAFIGGIVHYNDIVVIIMKTFKI
jgi:hypothetical protein